MSHYAVAVFSNDGDIDTLMRPYNENDHAYFVFQPVPYEEIEADFNKFKQQNPSWTLEMYIRDNGYIQENGQWGYRHNPNAKYDYYTSGGKAYLFDPKPGEELDEDEWDWRKSQIDWYPKDDENEDRAAEFWDKYIADGAKHQPPGLYTRRYYQERYKTKEQYIKECTRTIPYAFVTPDGVWHAPGNVGWFAVSDETMEDWNRYAQEWDDWIASKEDPYVDLVDCHI